MCRNKLEVFLFVYFLWRYNSRLYRINEFLTFLGDEGRDVRIVRDIYYQR